MGGECEGTGEGERRQKVCVVKEGVGGGRAGEGRGLERKRGLERRGEQT